MKKRANVIPCSPSSGDCGEGVMPSQKETVVRPFNYTEQNGYVKILIRRFKK